MNSLVDQLLARSEWRNERNECVVPPSMLVEAAEAIRLASTGPDVGRLREALEWYGEQARLARLVHSGGDAGRRALAEDGGKRARDIIAEEVGHTCAALASRTDANDPQDCDWPVCGCDPVANKVIEALEESGKLAALAIPDVGRKALDAANAFLGWRPDMTILSDIHRRDRDRLAEGFEDFAKSIHLASPDAREGERLREALADIAAERQRQIDKEGWTPEHDDVHADGGELSRAAACYAAHASAFQRVTVDLTAYRTADPARHDYGWPWSSTWWKPSTPRRDLVKAGALIVAEIERLDRAALRATDDAGGA